MRVAVDVHLGKHGIAELRARGHDVVVVADHGESDRSWFDRALVAGAEVVISPDRDLSILCYDRDVGHFRFRSGTRGRTVAILFDNWALRWSAYRARRRVITS